MTYRNGQLVRAGVSNAHYSRAPMTGQPQDGPSNAAEPSWIRRLLGRKKPTTFQRCLAVHIHFAGPHSALY